MSGIKRLPWRLRYYTAAKWASRYRRLSARATHRHTDLSIDAKVRLGPRFALWIPAEATVRIGPGCELRRDFFAEVNKGATVLIGAGTVFTGQATIQISTSLVIGERCVFGVGTMIADGNHRFRDYTKHLLDQGYDFTPVTIGDGAVVTSKCTILAPIGRGAVIGSNSVVTRPVPDYCLAAGAPARVIEYFGPPEHRPDIPDLDV